MSIVVTEKLPNPPTIIEHGIYRFMIFDAPNDLNVPLYIREFQRENVNHVVRACNPSYSADKLSEVGIRVHELTFEDGGVPSERIITEWRVLLKNIYGRDKTKTKNATPGDRPCSTKPETVGVHCVAGLGRAPVLVALALIHAGVDTLRAIQIIRDSRRNAFNQNQLSFLKSYHSENSCCNCTMI